MWNQVSAVLEEAHGILAELQSYNGAGQEIREVSGRAAGGWFTEKMKGKHLSSRH